jgi:hypothetical protein
MISAGTSMSLFFSSFDNLLRRMDRLANTSQKWLKGIHTADKEDREHVWLPVQKNIAFAPP